MEVRTSGPWERRCRQQSHARGGPYCYWLSRHSPRVMPFIRSRSEPSPPPPVPHSFRFWTPPSLPPNVSPRQWGAFINGSLRGVEDPRGSSTATNRGHSFSEAFRRRVRPIVVGERLALLCVPSVLPSPRRLCFRMEHPLTFWRRLFEGMSSSERDLGELQGTGGTKLGAERSGTYSWGQVFTASIETA